MLSMGKAARAAARTLATSPESVRNAALHAMAAAIRVNAGQILKANAADSPRYRQYTALLQGVPPNATPP